MTVGARTPSIETMPGLRALIASLTLASAGCSIALPVVAATSDVPPDRTPKEDRIALAIVFGVMTDSFVVGVIYLVHLLRKR